MPPARLSSPGFRSRDRLLTGPVLPDDASEPIVTGRAPVGGALDGTVNLGFRAGPEARLGRSETVGTA
jgi:hypothetical protein